MLGEYFPWVVVEPSHNRASPAMAVIVVGYRPPLAAQWPRRDWCEASHSSPRPTTRWTSGALGAPTAQAPGTSIAAGAHTAGERRARRLRGLSFSLAQAF